jgi:two-component SAPR family response regulator
MKKSQSGLRHKHPTAVEGFDGSLSLLAHRVGSLRYDKLKEFLDALADDFLNQAHEDMHRKRPQLASKLLHASAKTAILAGDIQGIFRLCKHHMRHELEEK